MFLVIFPMGYHKTQNLPLVEKSFRFEIFWVLPPLWIMVDKSQVCHYICPLSTHSNQYIPYLVKYKFLNKNVWKFLFLEVMFI